MAIVGILLFLTAPLLFGVGISSKCRERNVGCLKGYLVGFLSLFVMMFAETLAMLKLDLSLKVYEWIVVATLAAMAVLGALLLALRRPVFAKPRIEKRMLWFLVPAVLLFAYSYFYLVPSFANNDTWEFVATSVAKGRVFEYSSMTGRRMIAGLPIFNKIQVMPLLYVVLADFFGIPVDVSAGVLVPAVVFVLNLSLIYAIGRELGCSDRSYFMILYMLVLMSGTYLPSFGVPVTLGYAILREGYCGYAVAYGVVIPAVLLLLLKKKYMWAAVTLATAVPFVRIDRIFFALMSPVKSIAAVNVAGKIAGVYLVAVIAALIYKAVKGMAIKWQVLLIPSIFVSYITEKLKDCLIKKRDIVLYSVGVAVIILSAVNFEPFDDSVTCFEKKAEDAKVLACLDDIKDGVIWAPVEFVSAARRLDGNTETLFGRDDNNPLMAGIDFENDEEMAREYKLAGFNIKAGEYQYRTENSTEFIIDSAVSEGVKYFVIPSQEGYEVKRMEELR